MDVNPRQHDPEFQDPNAADSERQSQFGMRSQADAPLMGEAMPEGASGAPSWGQRDVIPGTPVYGSDDKKVGTVQESYNDSFMVKSGFFFVHDYYIPYGAIARADPERIVLSMTGDDAKHQDWQHRPQSATTASQQAGEYGVYGPEGPQDTVQSATERGARPESMPPTGQNAGPNPRPNAPPLVPPANQPDDAIPLGPSTAQPSTTQGDMAYRNIVGPANDDDAASRPYNPGWQGTHSTPDAGPVQPEEDPTSWNPEQQRPYTDPNNP